MISLGFLLKANSDEAQAALKKMESAVSASASAIEGDFSKASSGILSKITSLTPGFGMLAGGVAAVGTAMVTMAMQSIDAGDKMYLASKRTGVSVEILGGLKLAAKEAGLSFDTVEMSMERMTRNLSPFATSGSAGAKALHSLGISATGVDGKMRPMGDILGDVADKFSHMKDGTEKTSAAMAIFGRSGAQLIPILDLGRAAIAKLTEEEKHNSGMTQQVADSDHVLHDELVQLDDKWHGFWTWLGQKFANTMVHIWNVIRKTGVEFERLGDGIVILVSQFDLLMDKMSGQKNLVAADEAEIKKFTAAMQDHANAINNIGTALDPEIQAEQTAEKAAAAKAAAEEKAAAAAAKNSESIGRETSATEKNTGAIKENLHQRRQQIEATLGLTEKRNALLATYEKQQKNPAAQVAPLEGGPVSEKLSHATAGFKSMDLPSMFGKQTVALTQARHGWLQYTQAITQGMQATGGMSDAMGAMYNKVAQIAEAHQKTNQLQDQSNQAMQMGTRNTKALTVAQGASLAEGTAMFIKNKKAQAIINAVAQTAEGIAALAMIPPDPVSAALHFASAAMWGVIAGTAGSGGGQGGGGGRGSANQGYRQSGGAGSQQGVVGGGGMLSRGGGGSGNYHQSVVNIYGGQITDTNNLQNMVTMLNQGGSTGTIRMNVAGTSATIPTPAY